MSVIRIPYFKTSRYRVETMVELADVKPDEKMADLGSGDGRIVIAFAKVTFMGTKTGIETNGYEIDEELRKLSLQNIKEANLKNAFIHNKDFGKKIFHNTTSFAAILCRQSWEDLKENLKRN